MIHIMMAAAPQALDTRIKTEDLRPRPIGFRKISDRLRFGGSGPRGRVRPSGRFGAPSRPRAARRSRSGPGGGRVLQKPAAAARSRFLTVRAERREAQLIQLRPNLAHDLRRSQWQSVAVRGTQRSQWQSVAISRISPTTCGASALTEYARFFVGKKTGGGPAVRGGSARCGALVGAATTGAVGSAAIVDSAALRSSRAALS